MDVTVRVLRAGNWSGLPARAVVIGGVIHVRAGDFVPVDMQVIAGTLRIDQSALTGESMKVPVRLYLHENPQPVTQRSTAPTESSDAHLAHGASLSRMS